MRTEGGPLRLTSGYLIFLGSVASASDAKTGFGIVEWRRQRCVGQWRLPDCTVDLGIPEMNPAQAFAAGARTMIIGVSPAGGTLEPAWTPMIIEALMAGLDIASGMHTRLGAVREIRVAADRFGRMLHNVRHPHLDLRVATGDRRSGRRLLTVGTDCAVGKKYAALSIHAEMERRGLRATFRATGQTGILIAGQGVPIDAVVADFVAGAAELLSPSNHPDHWDIIEGQGSLFHPAYAGVSLGLLHGSQPDAIVVCHDPARPHIDGYPQYPIPSLERCISANLEAARLTNPNARCVGIAINGSRLTSVERMLAMDRIQDQFSVACFDPIATGAGALVDALV